MLLTILLLIVAGCVTAGAHDEHRPSTRRIHIDTGIIEGVIHSAHPDVYAYRGIPFAEPPLGRLRFAAPQPKKPWNGVFNASAYGNVCHRVGEGVFVPAFGIESEDCLSLNVFTPASASPHTVLPVMVWIHGGGFMVGSSGNPATSPDPAALVSFGNFVYVSMNYRLGPLGFMAYPSDSPSAGVMGIMDQQLALHWVQRNIHAFGGDPTNVTLAGESGGAFSECFHLTAPSSRGLFHRVIMMSGICDWPFDTLEQGHAQALALSHAIGCDDHNEPLKCLQDRDAKRIQNILPSKRGMMFFHGYRWFPVLSPAFVPATPMELIRTGHAHTSDVMVGSVAHEGTLFVLLAFPMIVVDGMFELIVDHSFTSEQARLLKHALPSQWSQRRKAARVFSDMFSCAVLRTAKALVALNADTHSSEVFLYNYAQTPYRVSWFLRDTLQVFHGSELASLFNVSSQLILPQECEVTRQMQHYWTHFIHSGNANRPHLAGYDDDDGTDVPHWPEFNMKTQLFWTFNESTSGRHQHVRTAHAHEHAKRIPLNEVFDDNDDDDAPSPFALCHFYDTFLQDNGLIRPIATFDEPWLSYFINVALLRGITKHLWLSIGGVVFILGLLAYQTGKLCSIACGWCCDGRDRRGRRLKTD